MYFLLQAAAVEDILTIVVPLEVQAAFYGLLLVLVQINLFQSAAGAVMADMAEIAELEALLPVVEAVVVRVMADGTQQAEALVVVDFLLT